MSIDINKLIQIIKSISHDTLLKILSREKTIIIQDGVTFIYLNYGREGIVYKFNDYALKFYRNKSYITNEIQIIKKYIIPLDENISNNFLKIYGTVDLFDHSVLIMELVDGNLQDWVLSMHTDKEWLTMLFHILYGIFVMQYHMKVFHSDVRPRNVLFKKLDRPINVKYIVEGNDITITTSFSTDTFFKIADFGKASGLELSHNKLPIESIKISIQNNIDLRHMRELYIRLAVDALSYSHTLKDLLKIGEKDKYFQGYVNKKKQQTDAYMPDDMKEQNLFRAVAYYLIEKNYFNLNNFPSAGKVFMPSKKIRDVLDLFEVTKDKKSMLNLLKKIGDMINEMSIVPDKIFIFNVA